LVEQEGVLIERGALVLYPAFWLWRTSLNPLMAAASVQKSFRLVVSG